MLIKKLLRGRPTAIRCLATGWLIVFLATLTLAIYGFLARFIPSDRFLDLVTVPAWIAATLIFAVGVLFYPHPTTDSSRVRDKIRQWTTILVCAIVLPYILWCGLIVGAPAVAHSFAPTSDAKRSFSVKARAPRYRGRRSRLSCRGKLYLQSNVRLLPVKACGIPEGEWRHAKADDEIRLEGESSWFGLKYSMARLIRD